jgi:hypothetical protein
VQLILLLLVFASLSSIPMAMHSRNGLHWGIFTYKNFLYLMVAVLITLELAGQRWRMMLDLAIFAAAVVSILSIASAASPAIRHFIVQFAPTSATSAAASFAAAGQLATATGSRIRLPGLFFAYAMLFPTIVLAIMVRDRWRLFRIVSVALILAAVGLSLNRNMYGGAAVGALLTILLAGPRVRHRFLLVAAVTLTTIVILALSSVVPAVTKQVASRASSALSPSQVVTSGSAQARANEFSHAFSSISAHPLDGVGWNQPYGAYEQDGGPAIGVENLPLHIATDLGIPSAVTFLVILGFVIAFGARQLPRSRRPLDQALIAAGIGATVALLLSSLVGTYGQEPVSMLAIGFACGFLLAASLRAVAPEATSDERPLPTPA